MLVLDARGYKQLRWQLLGSPKVRAMMTAGEVKLWTAMMAHGELSCDAIADAVEDEVVAWIAS